MDSDYDFFGGGGFYHDRGEKSDKPSLIEMSKNRDIQLILDNAEFIRTKQSLKLKQFIHQRLDSLSAMPYAIDRQDNDLKLSQIVEKSIELLENPNGFFMMVEGGKIDWASHSNDAAAVIHDVIDFDKAIGVALEFYKRNPKNTLIVVCADHETGGLALGFEEQKYESSPSLLQNQIVSMDSLVAVFNNYYDIKKNNANYFEALDTLKKYVGLGTDLLLLTQKEHAQLKNLFNETFKNRSIISSSFDSYEFASGAIKILNNKCGVGWTTKSHTSMTTGVFATGINSEIFAGFYNNTDIPQKIMQALKMSHDFENVENHDDTDK